MSQEKIQQLENPKRQVGKNKVQMKKYQKDNSSTLTRRKGILTNTENARVKTQIRDLDLEIWQCSNEVSPMLKGIQENQIILDSYESGPSEKVPEGSSHSLKGKSFPRAVSCKANPCTQIDHLKQPKQDSVLSSGLSQILSEGIEEELQEQSVHTRKAKKHCFKRLWSSN